MGALNPSLGLPIPGLTRVPQAYRYHGGATTPLDLWNKTPTLKGLRGPRTSPMVPIVPIQVIYVLMFKAYVASKT